MCGLARVTNEPDSFILMGGDAIHQGGELRPHPWRPLPEHILPDPFSPKSHTPCVGEIFDKLLPGGREVPFYHPIQKPNSVHADVYKMAETIKRLQEFDAHDNILLVAAHDAAFLNVANFFPSTANAFIKKGWVEKTRWAWLAEFAKAVGREEDIPREPFGDAHPINTEISYGQPWTPRPRADKIVDYYQYRPDVSSRFPSPVSVPLDIGMSFLEIAVIHVDEHYEPTLSPHIAIDGLTLHSKPLRDSLIGFFDRVTLGRAFETLGDHERNCCWVSLRVADGYARGYLDMPSSANGGLSIFRAVLQYDQIHTTISLDSSRQYNFVKSMKTFRLRLCPDPCDRIYGMLGLKLKDEKIRDLIQTNYYTLTTTLFQDVAMILVEQSGTLDILSDALLRSQQYGNYLAGCQTGTLG
ncbi:hypothetical protein CHU98_g10541 [Xylaria longipes]|nr:hypothetical protein CHU98_g10541 [Xylaria longipes]